MRGPVLIVGRGQLARALLRSRSGLSFAAVGRPELDFDRPETIAPALRRFAPRAIVNTAAYTSVDGAETDPAAAWRANHDGPRRVARFCAEHSLPLIQLSTDYVFDGAKGAPYVESDRTAPLNVYGVSKLAGEKATLEEAEQAIVLRTAGLISDAGHNFVRTVLARRGQPGPLRVIADQRGSPTAAADLACAICGLLRRIARDGWRKEYGGVFHAAGNGEASPYELARTVFEEARRYGARSPKLVPIAAAGWPAAARRPADSRLDCRHLALVFGLRLPSWRVSLGTIVEQVLAGPGEVESPSLPGTRARSCSR